MVIPHGFWQQFDPTSWLYILGFLLEDLFNKVPLETLTAEVPPLLNNYLFAGSDLASVRSN